MKTLTVHLFFILEGVFLLLCLINCIYARKYPEDNFFSRNYFDEQQYAQISAGIEKLAHSPEWVRDWPDHTIKLGQVSGVALDSAGHIFVFHRATHVWDANTFNENHVYQGIGKRAISQPTILMLNDTGEVIDMWGQNLFHIPHGITVDGSGNIWVTDVALHQVFKFTPDKKNEPNLILGEKFVPGSDDEHFCKPSAVVVHPSGDFFVADGYCNTRIIKYAPDGTKLLQWGRRTGQSPYTLSVPHALTLAEGGGAVCAADRERGRIACYRADNGTFLHSYSHWLIGPRLFSVAYAPVHGGRLYLVNGPSLRGGIPVRGYVIDYTSGRLIQTFAAGESLTNPHDIAVSPDGSRVYVAELYPYKVYKFTDESLRNESFSTTDTTAETAPAKPTATVEVSGAGAVSGAGWAQGWGGAAGGALAAAAATLALATLALLNARNRGRKGVSRRRWEYGHGEFKLRRLLDRRRFTRVHSDDSDEEPAPMLPTHPPANA